MRPGLSRRIAIFRGHRIIMVMVMPAFISGQ